MKLIRVVVTLGTFFLMSQGMLVFLFQSMLDLTTKQKLPVDQLLQFQTFIVKLLIGSLIVFGAMFCLVVVLLAVQALRAGTAAVPVQWKEESRA